MAAMSEKQTFLVVTAGQSRVGKSTAMNNALGTNFKAKCSAFSVTKDVEVRYVDMKTCNIIVIDTPGLAATDINPDKIKKKIKSTIEGLSLVLVYCISVSPSSSHSTADEQVVKKLQRAFGKNVWKKCVILFTNSDTLRREQYPRERNREEYKDILREHAKRLAEMLHRVCGSHVPDVKMVFDLDKGQIPDINKDAEIVDPMNIKVHLKKVSEIVAVPVGQVFKQGRESHVLLPDMNNLNWKINALTEILRKAGPIDLVLKSPDGNFIPVIVSIFGGAGGAVVGGAVGAAIGAGVGAGAGGFGAIPGAVAGGAVGVFIGAVVGSPGTGFGAMVVQKVDEVKQERQIDRISKLKKAERITPSNKKLPSRLNAEDPDISSIASESYDMTLLAEDDKLDTSNNHAKNECYQLTEHDPEDPEAPEEPENTM